MKYLIYLSQDYDEVFTTSVEVGKNEIELAKSIIDDLGDFIGVMDEPAKSSSKEQFKKYAIKKYKYLLKQQKELEKEYQILSKKTQKDLDEEYIREKAGQESFVGSLGGNVTIALPFIMPQEINSEKREIKNELRKIKKQLEKL